MDPELVQLYYSRLMEGGKRKSVRLWGNPDKTTVASPSDF